MNAEPSSSRVELAAAFVLAAALAAVLLPSPPPAGATIVATTEGEVTVMGGPERNELTVREAQVHITDETVGDVFLAFVAPQVPLYRTLETQVQGLLAKIAEPPGPPGTTQSSSATKWNASIVGMIALLLAPDLNSKEALETDRAILVREHNAGAPPPQPVYPCHWVRIKENVDQRQVLCPMLNTQASNLPPSLRVAGEGGDDVIDLDLKTEVWFSERNVYGGDGVDHIKGSKFVDWIRTHSDSGAADVIDCANPNPLDGPPSTVDFADASQTGDMIDPGWEDLEQMSNCEDVALPALPEELANSGDG